MQRPEVKAFKYELRNYSFYCYRVRTLSESIEYCYQILGGVHGVDPSRIPMHSPKNLDREYKLRDEISRLEAEKDRLQRQIDYVDQILDRIGNGMENAIKSVYIEGQQMRKVADDYYLSHSGLQGRINKAIMEALNED